MKEIFEPRANMVYVSDIDCWECIDGRGNMVCDGGPSRIWGYVNHWHFFISGIGLHRLDGPANSYGEWFIHGKDATMEIHWFAKENSIDLENLTDEDKVLISLRFG